MNNQEMQFAEPEQRPPQSTIGNNPDAQEPYTPQPVNMDPREQPQWEAMPAQEEGYGYRGEAPYIGPAPEKIGVGPYAGRQRAARRRRGPWFWIILVLIIVAILGASSHRMIGGFGPHHHIQEPTKHFAGFTSTPTIVVNNDAGNISVQTSTDNSVTINATEQSGGFLDNNAQVTYTQSDDKNTIHVDVGNSSFFNGGGVDFALTVPANTNLTLKTESGDISVSNVNGQIALTTSSGSIQATDDTFTGATTLQTESGDINATRDTLTNASTLKTDSGSVTFDGSIGASGTYHFQTDSGDVNVSLPSNSPFHVDASTGSGSISSDFPEVNVQSNDSGANAHGDVGTSPNATVNLTTDSGSIHLQQH